MPINKEDWGDYLKVMILKEIDFFKLQSITVVLLA